VTTPLATAPPVAAPRVTPPTVTPPVQDIPGPTSAPVPPAGWTPEP
jgi:hypothetical protein